MFARRNPHTRARPRWERRSLLAYCKAQGITATELAQAEEYAKIGNNGLYQGWDTWLMGIGGEQSSEYDRIPLIVWVERERDSQG